MPLQDIHRNAAMCGATERDALVSCPRVLSRSGPSAQNMRDAMLLAISVFVFSGAFWYHGPKISSSFLQWVVSIA
jgi:hypothetical protein